MASLTEVASAALCNMHPMIWGNETGIHAVISDDGRGALLQYLTDGLYRWCETPVKPDHQQWAVRVVCIKLFDFRQLALLQSQRFLHENMFAGTQSLQSHVTVEIVACSYHDQSHLVVLEYFLIIGDAIRSLI